MKKIIKKGIVAVIMGAMLVSAGSVTVFAADTDPSMTVKYEQATTYTLSIPKTVTLTADATGATATVGVSAVNTTPTQKVAVKVKSGIANGKVTLSRTGDASTSVTSVVTNSANVVVANDDVIVEFQNTSITHSGTLTGVLNFAAIKDSTSDTATVKAGSYTGTMTFEGAIVDID